MSVRNILVRNGSTPRQVSSEMSLAVNDKFASLVGRLLRKDSKSATRKDCSGKGVHVVGENNAVVKHLKEVLPSVPYNVSVVRKLEDANYVLLVVETYRLNWRIKKALRFCKQKNLHFLVLYVTKGSRTEITLLNNIQSRYSFIKDAEWIPYFAAPMYNDYQHTALMTVLRCFDLHSTFRMEQSWDFFISHKQQHSQGIASDLYTQLRNLGFRVWWDVKMDDLTVNGMMKGVANSANFLLILDETTMDGSYVAKEVEKALSEKKKILVLHRPLFTGCFAEGKEGFVSRLFETHKKNFHMQSIVTMPWITVDMFWVSARRVNLIVEACGQKEPNKILSCKLQSVESSIVNRIGNKTLHLAREFHQGTREWLLQLFDKWSSCSTGNKVFIVLGQSGVGKSTLTAEITRRAWGQWNGSSSVVAAHYFDYNSRNQGNSAAHARSALFSICQQLRNNLPGFREIIDAQLSDLNDVSNLQNLNELVERLIANPAMALLQSFDENEPRKVIVLDAIDECSDGRETWNILHKAWQSNKIPAWLGLYVTCDRDTFELYSTEEEVHGVTLMETDNYENMEDVKLVLRSWLNEIADEVTITKLAERSQGVFLYLRFLKEHLVDGKNKLTDNDVEACPIGVDGFYDQYFERLLHVMGNEFYHLFLVSIVASGSPVPLELLMRVCSVTLKRFNAALELCKSLLHVPLELEHESLCGVAFIHKSIPYFLTKGKTAVIEPLGQENSKLRILRDNEPCFNTLVEQVRKVFQNPDETATTVTKLYSYRNMFSLQCKTGLKTSDAQAIVFNLDSLLTWLAGSSPLQVLQQIQDFFPVALVQQDEVQVILNLLRLGRNALLSQNFGIRKKYGKQFPSQLPSQILGRLSEQDVAHLPRLKELRDAASRYDPGFAWLKPATASLVSAMPDVRVQTTSDCELGFFSVAYNHDGSRFVSGSRDSTVRIWDACTGQQIGEPLKGHTKPVNSVAYNHDGTRIVSGSRDRTIRIWDAITGQRIGGPLTGNIYDVLSVAYNHDGTRIVSGGYDNTVRIWDAITGKQIGEPLQDNESSSVNSVVYNHDGTRIVAGFAFGSIQIWDSLSRQRLIGWRAHDNSVKSVAFNHNGTRIVSGSGDRTVRVWYSSNACHTLKPQVLEGHSAWVSSVAYNHDGTRIVSGSGDGTVRIWDAITGMPIGEPRSQPDSVSSVAFNHDGTRVVSCDYDKAIRVWDTAVGQSMSESLTDHASSLTASILGNSSFIHFTPDTPSNMSPANQQIESLITSFSDGHRGHGLKLVKPS